MTPPKKSFPYDAILLQSFGGPEGMDEVIPFLENVLRGRHIPRARLEEVAEHYRLFNGISPINSQNRALIEALKSDLTSHGIDLPIYFGNRNWHPLLGDTMRQMVSDGVRRVLVLVTSAYSSYSGCRQYREDIARAQTELGSNAPQCDKIRVFYNHPGFIEANADCARQALDKIASERRQHAALVFTSHSIPLSMARTSDYVAQLQDAASLIAEAVDYRNWDLVFQSRSGPPHQPWLEPSLEDHLRVLKDRGAADVLVVPIGFLSDHMEVIFDLDVEARQQCEALGLNLVRASTVGTHPVFITALRQLIEERLTDTPNRLALGHRGPSPDICPDDCCLAPSRAGEKPE
jgi:ferrochelatase